MTLKQAAQSALDYQNACNASGLIRTLNEIVQDVLWPYARTNSFGTRWVNTHPIVSMFLFKIGELNGCGIDSLHPRYLEAEQKCKQLITNMEAIEQVW